MIKFKNKLDKKDWPKIKNFFKQNYRKDHPILNRKFFFWQFNVQKKINVLCALENNKIIGMIGYLDLDMYLGSNKKIISTWLLYWKANNSAPNGIGLILLRKIKKIKKNIFSINVSDIGKLFYKKNNWDFFNEIKRNYIVLNKKKSKNLLINKRNSSQINNHFINKKLLNEKTIIKKLNLKSFKVNLKKYKGLKYSIKKDKNFFDWRYFKHPFFNYEIFYEGPAKEPAICVLRIEKYYGKSTGKISRILEFFYPENNNGKKNASKLLKKIFKYLIEQNCDLVDFYCSYKNYSNLFNSFSISKKKNYKTIFINRCLPIMREEFKQNLFYNLKDNINLNKDKIYITKSDVAGDNPTRILKNSKIV